MFERKGEEEEFSRPLNLSFSFCICKTSTKNSHRPEVGEVLCKKQKNFQQQTTIFVNIIAERTGTALPKVCCLLCNGFYKQKTGEQ